jgi:predicted phage terminase large subunit-like protein
MIDKEKVCLGKYWIIQGFAIWFRCLFKLVEDRPFIVEAIHHGLFDAIDKVIKGVIKRLNINLPPRAGKTTLATYLLVFAITINPKANIIYTSYSQSLLTDIALRVRDILEHPIYKALYPSNINYESEEVAPQDDFWAEYLRRETGKNTYSAKKIITSKGGTCLFSSIGSQITGYGAGIRNAKGFTGALIIDDPNKPDDIYHSTLRNRVIRYFSGTLLSRLNNPDVPIINIQQRLHLEDLSGILETRYGFETLKCPLVDSNGVCQIPSQYTPERIKELQVDNYVFTSQYQQEPIVLGGQVIKGEWFGYYPVNTDFNYKRIIIAADTAISAKECNDFSCFLVGGITAQNKLHILEMVHGKWEYPELKQEAIALYNRWQLDKRQTSASCIVIENRASGQQMIQDFKKAGLPIQAIEVTKDKLSRVQEVLTYIANGNVLLPENEQYSNNPVLLAECEAFTRDMAHSHDDIVDTLVHLINNTIAKRQISILDVL